MPYQLKKPYHDIGCVLIGRNEGLRLQAAIESIPSDLHERCIYVDSGSTDGSQKRAKDFGLTVIELDLRIPFTAARARNAGAEILLAKFPDLKFIQFIDGDCRLYTDWLSAATDFLNKHPDVAVVCGRRREMYPEKTIYNWLCDIEWNTPIGYADACGGDFMIRSDVFKHINGFNPKLIAGEEPELCYRIRKNNLKIYRLDHDMTQHDANILTFKQWFNRAKRSGYAYTEAVYLNRHDPNAYWKRELKRIVSWGIALPFTAILCSLYVHPAFITLFLLYPAQITRIAIRSNLDSHKWTYGLFMVMSKLPETIGLFMFIRSLLTDTDTKIIEYK